MIERVVKGAVVGILVIVLLWGMIASVRWAKKGGTGAAALSILLMLFGGGVPPPQQTIEEAREADGKKRRDHRGRDGGMEE